MSIIQGRKELRYIRQKNLEEESRVVGNYFRDLIRSYGVDVCYYKLSVPFPEHFSTTIDQNTILLNAYGYDDHPDWSISANMVSYMEVGNDIFNLTRFGAMPTTDVTFYFDSIDYAMCLAPQLGRLKEYPVEKQEFMDSASTPEELEGKKIRRDFFSGLLSGTVEFDFSEVGEVSLGDPVTMWGRVVRKTEPCMLFKANRDLYRSFNYRLSDDDCEDIRIWLRVTVTRYATQGYRLACVMGGAVLFRDLESMGKYASEIVPTAGDIVTIDFPDKKSGERFEITSCTDRQLTPDGLNPLLHRYIWKCAAKRLVTAEDGFPEKSEAEDILQERLQTTMVALEDVSNQVSVYPDEEDKVYGGYVGPKKIQPTNPAPPPQNEGAVQDSGLVVVFDFPDGSALVTDGFTPMFRKSGEPTPTEIPSNPVLVVPESTLKEGHVRTREGDMMFFKGVGKDVYFTAVDGSAKRLSASPSEDGPEHGPISMESLNTPTIYTEATGDDRGAGAVFIVPGDGATALESAADGKQLWLVCHGRNKSKARLV